MRIAVLSYWSCPKTRLGVLAAGGMNVYVANFTKYLSDLGHHVDIYTTVHSGSHETVISVGNARIIHVGTQGANHKESAVRFGRNVYEYVRKNQLSYDIAHAHYYYSGLTAIELKKGASIPFVITFHTLSATKVRYGGIEETGRFEIEKIVVDASDAIVASTHLEKQELVNNHNADKDKVSVVHPGVNHHIFKPYDKSYARSHLQIPQDKKIILFVGRIDPIKGISFLIEAIHKLTNTYPAFVDNFRLLLIGGDITSRSFWQHPEVIKIKTLIARKDLECCIKFLGSKPHNDLPYYYSASDVVVLPSVYESFGFVVLEAMACGSVVVASKVGGLKYLVKDGESGILFEAGNTNDLCGALEKLFNKPSFANKLGRKAYRESLKYCWDIQTGKLVKTYDKIVS